MGEKVILPIFLVKTQSAATLRPFLRVFPREYFVAKRRKVVDFCLVYNFVVLSFFKILLEKFLQPLQKRSLARFVVCVLTLGKI